MYSLAEMVTCSNLKFVQLVHQLYLVNISDYIRMYKTLKSTITVCLRSGSLLNKTETTLRSLYPVL